MHSEERMLGALNLFQDNGQMEPVNGLNPSETRDQNFIWRLCPSKSYESIINAMPRVKLT